MWALLLRDSADYLAECSLCSPLLLCWLCLNAEQQGNITWSHSGASLAAKMNFLLHSDCIWQKYGKRGSSGEDSSKHKE